MRIVFFALLLANLLYYGWGRWVGTPQMAAPTHVSAPNVPLLQLVSSAELSTPTRCRSLGPFSDMSAATSAAQQLRSHGDASRIRTVESSTPDGFWVYIGELKDPVEQRMALARLNAAGIHDSEPVTAPEQTDRVSVGIFTDQAHAVKRAEQVRQLGFKPVLDIHQRPSSEHWLDVQLKLADSDPQASQFQGASSSGASAPAADPAAGLKVVECPAKKGVSG